MNESPNEDTLMSDVNLFSGDCFICFCPPNEPVITHCGHIYCWPCIFTWLNSNRTTLSCPVCKNGISVDELIPIYTRNESDQISKKIKKDQDNSNQDNSVKERNGIPPRPQARRRKPMGNQNSIGGDLEGFTGNQMFNIHNGNNLAGFGFFPPVAFIAVTTNCDVDIKDP